VWFWNKFADDDLICYYRLLKSGITDYAEIIEKGIVVESHLRSLQKTHPKDDYQLSIQFNTSVDDIYICDIGVSKSLYDEKSIGDLILITYLPENPQKCQLSSTIASMKNILLFGFGMSALLLIIVLATTLLIYHAIKRSRTDKFIKHNNKKERHGHDVRGNRYF
jgi:hypothetical protein